MADATTQPKLSQFELMWDQMVKTEEGRAVLWWVMEEAGTFSENLFCEPHARDLCEGQRSIGLRVFKRLTSDVFHQMQEEAKLRKEIDDGERNDDHDGNDRG